MSINPSSTIINDFSSYDNAGVSSMSATVVDMLNTNSIGNVTTLDVDDMMNRKTFPGYSYDTQNKVMGTMSMMEKKYKEEIVNLIKDNKINNLNIFVDNVYNTENQRIQDILKKTSTDLVKMRETFMNERYYIHTLKFDINIIMITFLTATLVSVAFALALWNPIKGKEEPMLSMKAAGIVVGAIITLYILIVVIAYKQNMRRRKDDYSKIVFNMDPTKADKMKAP